MPGVLSALGLVLRNGLVPGNEFELSAMTVSSSEGRRGRHSGQLRREWGREVVVRLDGERKKKDDASLNETKTDNVTEKKVNI